jgi:two-component system response regulator CpxR
VGRILIVDDDAELVEMLSEYLGSEGFETDTTGLGKDGAERAVAGGYSLAVLDVMLPDVNGFEVLRRIRAHSQVPVLMLTARAEEVDRIVGLEIGADDYLRKPFSPRELVARVQAILRRTEAGAAVKRAAASAEAGALVVGDLQLDARGRVARRGGRLISLTGAEFELLKVLLTTPGRVVSREEMTRAVLGREHTTFDRSIDNHMSALRKKLGKDAKGLDRIRSVRNIGYVYAYVDE